MKNIATPIPDFAELVTIEGECSVDILVIPTAKSVNGVTITGVANVTFPITEIGEITIIWTYDDGNGNTATQTQKIIITDSSAPEPDNANLPDIEGEYSVDSVSPPTAQDYCNGSITATCDTEFPISWQGLTEITWEFDDGHGNVSVQKQNIVIKSIDNTVEIIDESLVAISEGYTYQWIDCEQGNKIIGGATDHKFAPGKNGSYAVIITNGSYSTTSDCFVLNALGIESMEDSILNVELYPNPVESILQVDVGNDYNTYLIEIFDILGNKIYASDTDKRMTKIDVEKLSTGIYIIRLVGEQKSVSKRFIKK